MKPILRFALVGLTGSLVGSLWGQPEIPFIMTAKPLNTFSGGFRMNSAQAKVSFGNLGILLAGGTDFNGNWVYADGRVNRDGLRLNEVDSTGKQLSVPGQPYRPTTTQVDANGNPVKDANGNPIKYTYGEFLPYTPGQTRDWNYSGQQQVAADGTIEMHGYSAGGNGTGTGDAKSSVGFELQLARELGASRTGRFAWGVAGAMGLTEINAKMTGTISADLITYTDRFKIIGDRIPTMPYTAPEFTDWKFPEIEGSDKTKEITVPLSQEPVSRTFTTTPGGARVDGMWQVKGAYYSIRLGPWFRYHLTQRISLTGGVGFNAAYIGSEFRAQERLVSPVMPSDVSLTGLSQRKTDLLMGFYGELNAEFWLTPRTGVYVGVVYENLGEYDQDLAGRTARVDVGGGTAIRVGIVYRF